MECRRIARLIAEEASRTTASEMGKHPMDKPRTGNLAKAYRVDLVEPNSFRVSNRKPYAAAIEFGVPDPHPIKARRVSHLQFRDRQGNWRKVVAVIHPGNKPYRHLARAAQTVATRLGLRF